MFSEKLLILLQTFTKYDLNRFRKFLLSPYFNEQEDLVRLFELCNNAVRQGPEAIARLDKPAVWRQMYPKQKLDDAHLRRLASDLSQQALKFRALEFRETNSLDALLDLQAALDEPEVAKHLTGVERQVQKELREQTGQSAQHYFYHFKTHWLIFSRASKVVSTADYVEKLLPADHYLDAFYLIQKLKLYVAWLIFRGFRSTEREMAVIPGFWEYLQQEPFRSMPMVVVYRQVILCLTEPNEERHFQELIRELDRLGDHFDKEDLRECYQIAQNYCAFKINQGRTEYYREVFDLFRNMIQRDLLLEKGQLAEGVYKNVITASLRAGEFKWAEFFIQEYSKHLPSSIRENARTYNLANLYSHQKKHDQVIELLRNVEYSDLVYALGAKLILLRTYYESGEYLAMDSLMDSFRIYLRRNKVISKNLKREYNNFLNFLKKLSSAATLNDLAVAAFQKRVKESQHVTSKKWLLEKIEELRRV